MPPPEAEEEPPPKKQNTFFLPAFALLVLDLCFGADENALDENTPVVEYDPYSGDDRSLVGVVKYGYAVDDEDAAALDAAATC